MTSTERGDRAPHEGWEEFGRVAEDFARRVARDARRFADHVEQHAGEFARDVARDWSSFWDRPRDPAAPDVRGLFDDVRKILAAVVDGVDELIGGIFAEAGDRGWTRVVSNRAATCSACGGAIAAGDATHVRRTAAGAEFRCLACGPDRKPA